MHDTERAASWPRTLAIYEEDLVSTVHGKAFQPLIEIMHRLRELGFDTRFFASQSVGRFVLSEFPPRAVQRPHLMITVEPDGRIGCELWYVEGQAERPKSLHSSVTEAVDAIVTLAESITTE